MSFGKKTFVIIFLYLLLPVFFSIQQNQKFLETPLRFIYPDEVTDQRLQTYLVAEQNELPIFLSRVLYNKISAYKETYEENFLRLFDPVGLFGLNDRSSLYDNRGQIVILFPLEFPLFLIAIIYWIKNWSKMKKYKLLLVSALFVALLTSFFHPTLHPLKLIPYVALLRLLIAVTFIEIIKEIKWSKK